MCRAEQRMPCSGWGQGNGAREWGQRLRGGWGWEHRSFACSESYEEPQTPQGRVQRVGFASRVNFFPCPSPSPLNKHSLPPFSHECGSDKDWVR